MPINPLPDIDYNLNVKTPFESFLGGYQTGAGLAQMQAKTEQAKLEAERLRQAQQEMQNFWSNPNPTMRDAARAASYLPKEQADALRPYIENMNKEQQQSTLQFGNQVLYALRSSNPEVGVKLLRDRAEAERNAGREDQAKAYEHFADSAEREGQSGAFKVITALVGHLPGAKEAFEASAKAEETQRGIEKAPFELTKAESEAAIKSAEAKFAPDKFGAELGLTKAQIDQAKASAAASRASAAASGAEAKRKTAEAQQMASGVIPLDKRPEAEGKMRKEYSDQTKGYQEVKSAYGRVLSAEDTAVGDLSLIFGYMKMLDPGSVVREGEFATAQNSAGVPERIQNVYNRAVRGERLTPGQRKSFKGQADKLYQSSKQHESTVRSGISRIAKGYGLSMENIFYEPSETAPAAPTPSGGVQVTAPNGQTLTFPNQEAADAFKQAAGIR